MKCNTGTKSLTFWRGSEVSQVFGGPGNKTEIRKVLSRTSRLYAKCWLTTKFGAARVTESRAFAGVFGLLSPRRLMCFQQQPSACLDLKTVPAKRWRE